jgi:hypothetical protein
MEYDKAKIEEALLALLGVFEFENGRVWKRYDFATMDALHAKGLISEPRSRQESVDLTGAACVTCRSGTHHQVCR